MDNPNALFDSVSVHFDSNGSMGIADYPAGSRFGPRLTTSYEFVWIIAGNVEWVRNEQSYAMPTGSVCLINPQCHDSFIWDPDTRTRHGYFHFSIDDRQNILGHYEDWPRVFHCGHQEFLMRLLNHVVHLAQDKSAISQSLAAHGLKHAVLAFVHQRAEGLRVDNDIEENPSIRKSLEYLQLQWRTRGMCSPAIEDIANAIGISRGHLVRIFKNETGMGPAECIRCIRLEHAATMLSRSNMTVQDISEECGFENQFHFSRAFKKLFTLSPRSYRQRIHSGQQVPVPLRAKIRQFSQHIT